MRFECSSGSDDDHTYHRRSRARIHVETRNAYVGLFVRESRDFDTGSWGYVSTQRGTKSYRMRQFARCCSTKCWVMIMVSIRINTLAFVIFTKLLWHTVDVRPKIRERRRSYGSVCEMADSLGRKMRTQNDTRNSEENRYLEYSLSVDSLCIK